MGHFGDRYFEAAPHEETMRRDLGSQARSRRSGCSSPTCPLQGWMYGLGVAQDLTCRYANCQNTAELHGAVSSHPIPT